MWSYSSLCIGLQFINMFQGFNPPSYVKMGNIFEILVNILGEKGYNLYILIDIIKLEIIDTP